MIPLGSCTMKLNATTEMEPITWPEFAGLHPFAPVEQAAGYARADRPARALARRDHRLRRGVAAAERRRAGRVAGLLAIRALPPRARRRAPRRLPDPVVARTAPTPASRGDGRHAGRRRRLRRAAATSTSTTCAPRSSEHARPPGRADGHLPVDARRVRGGDHARSARSCTTHGGQVYMDGANLNALVGLASPGEFGADVCHLNLHKTFCIPHGGGGPGIGPVAVRAHLAPYLPSHPLRPEAGPATRRRPGRRRRRGARRGSCRSRGRTSR